jgi:hypothetical protein
MTKQIKNKNLTFRTRSDMRDRLAHEATGHGRSISEEIEARLEGSFLHEATVAELQQRVRDLETRANEDRLTISRLTAVLAGADDDNKDIQTTWDRVLGAIARLPHEATRPALMMVVNTLHQNPQRLQDTSRLQNIFLRVLQSPLVEGFGPPKKEIGSAPGQQLPDALRAPPWLPERGDK